MITLRTLSGAQIKLEVKPLETVESIYPVICKKLQLENQTIKLIYAGKVLSPNQTFESIKYKEGDFIIVKVSKQENEEFEKSVGILTEMGFDRNESIRCLNEAGGNVEKAREMLTNKGLDKIQNKQNENSTNAQDSQQGSEKVSDGEDEQESQQESRDTSNEEDEQESNDTSNEEDEQESNDTSNEEDEQESDDTYNEEEVQYESNSIMEACYPKPPTSFIPINKDIDEMESATKIRTNITEDPDENIPKIIAAIYRRCGHELGNLISDNLSPLLSMIGVYSVIEDGTLLLSDFEQQESIEKLLSDNYSEKQVEEISELISLGFEPVEVVETYEANNHNKEKTRNALFGYDK